MLLQLLLVPLWLLSVVSGETLWVVEEGSVEITNGGPDEEVTIVDLEPFVLGGKSGFVFAFFLVLFPCLCPVCHYPVLFLYPLSCPMTCVLIEWCTWKCIILVQPFDIIASD
jgi:hypothetical protein